MITSDKNSMLSESTVLLPSLFKLLHIKLACSNMVNLEFNQKSNKILCCIHYLLVLCHIFGCFVKFMIRFSVIVNPLLRFGFWTNSYRRKWNIPNWRWLRSKTYNNWRIYPFLISFNNQENAKRKRYGNNRQPRKSKIQNISNLLFLD